MFCVAEEEVVEEAQQHGILDTKPKDDNMKADQTGKEGESGKTHTDSQGLSVAESTHIKL